MYKRQAEQATAGDALLGWAALAAVVIASVASLLGLQRLWRGLAWGEDMTVYRPDDPTTGRGTDVPLPDDVRIPWRLLAPGAAMMALSLVIFVGIGALLPAVDSSAADLLDVGSYVEAVMNE